MMWKQENMIIMYMNIMSLDAGESDMNIVKMIVMLENLKATFLMTTKTVMRLVKYNLMKKLNKRVRIKALRYIGISKYHTDGTIYWSEGMKWY